MDAPPVRWEFRAGIRSGGNVLVDLRHGYFTTSIPSPGKICASFCVNTPFTYLNFLIRWRCSRHRSNRCRVMVSFGNNAYVVLGEHSHPNDRQLIRNLEMENWCRLEAINSPRSLHQIYLDATER